MAVFPKIVSTTILDRIAEVLYFVGCLVGGLLAALSASVLSDAASSRLTTVIIIIGAAPAWVFGRVSCYILSGR